MGALAIVLSSRLWPRPVDRFRCSNDYPQCKELSGRKGNLTADPRFADAASGNVHLLPGSPAIDAGVAIDGLTDDYDGVARPQGSGVDIGIGAFEYRP